MWLVIIFIGVTGQNYVKYSSERGGKMKYMTQNGKGIIVFTGKKARELLRRGYTIIDVKPDKANKIKSVYVFKRENEMRRKIAKITYKKAKNHLHMVNIKVSNIHIEIVKWSVGG